MKKTILTILNLIITLAVIGQCSVTFTKINSIWCNCTGYLLANPTGTSPFDYQWSTGDTTNYIDSLCPGYYVVTVTDNLGCIAIDTATITNTQPQMSLGFTTTPASCPTCCDATVNINVNGGCPPFNYIWTPYDPYFCAGTTYTFVVTDNCGCTTQDSITIDTITVGLTEYNFQNNLFYKINDRTLTFSSPIIDLKIFDMLGNLVFNYSEKEFSKIDLFDLKSGLYIMKAQSMTGQRLADKIKIIK
jgi:hypothetical protein